LTPRVRARELIKVAHPVFREQLTAYLDQAEAACAKTNSMHEPHMLSKAFKMHINQIEKGTMVLDGW
jgi:acetyl-CoA hydrolase